MIYIKVYISKNNNWLLKCFTNITDILRAVWYNYIWSEIFLFWKEGLYEKYEDFREYLYSVYGKQTFKKALEEEAYSEEEYNSTLSKLDNLCNYEISSAEMSEKE